MKTVSFLVLCGLTLAARPASGSEVNVCAWGDDGSGVSNVPADLTNIVAISAGYWHHLAVRDNGRVVAWGGNYGGDAIVPDMTNIVAVASGSAFNLALQGGGRVLAWGGINFWDCYRPPEDLTNATAISCGYQHCMALTTAGTVVAWGVNFSGECTVPPGLSDVAAISAGDRVSLALKSNGTVVAWGENSLGQCDVPPDLTNAIAVDAGGNHCVALRANGTVVAWGHNGEGECNVPPGLTDVVAVDAGYFFNLALKKDGTVVAWGENGYGQCNVPAGLPRVIKISACYDSSLVLLSYGLTIVRQPVSRTVPVGATAGFAVDVAASPPLQYQWFFNFTNVLAGGTNPILTLPDLSSSQSGAYSVAITNVEGAVTSQPALLNVIPWVDVRSVPGIEVQGTPGTDLNIEYAETLNPVPQWLPLSAIHLQSTPYVFYELSGLASQRFYRARQSTGGRAVPRMSIQMVPAITLTGNVGEALRIDYINAYGPVDAWSTLTTVTLTNTSQLIFDTESVGQPERCYRILPAP